MVPQARKKSARLDFAFVFPNKDGRYIMKEVGRVFSEPGDRTDDGARTLNTLRFQTVRVMSFPVHSLDCP